MSAFVDHQIGQIDEEKGAVLAEGVDQESYIEDEPGGDAVARGGPPVLCRQYWAKTFCKYSPIRRIVAGSHSARQVTAVLLRRSAVMHY